MKNYIQILTCIGFLFSSSYNYSPVQAEEFTKTKSICVAYTIEEHLLQLLLISSGIVLTENPAEIKEEILNVKEKINSMADELSTFLNHTLMMEIEKLKGNNLPDTSTTLAPIGTEETGRKEKESTGDQTSCINSTSEMDIVDSDLSKQILETQNETNVLLKNLFQETQNISSLRNEIDTIIKENQELELKLKQKRTTMTRPRDCNDLRISGATKSGVYEIYPHSCRCKESVRVWCDMENEGGGWTVLIARGHGTKKENFTRLWIEYETGFGLPEGEYWIGNSHLHLLTSNRHYSVRLDVTSKSGRSKWAQWENFAVASDQEKYKLTVSGFDLSSSLGDVFKAHNFQYFTTYDQDNDLSFKRNCGQIYKGGWWYGNCYDIHPTGIIDATEIMKGVSTSFFSYQEKSTVALKKLTIRIKPKSCVFDSTLNDFSQMHCNYNDGQ